MSLVGRLLVDGATPRGWRYMAYRITTPQVYTTTEFAALHGVSAARIRKLTRDGRVYPYRKTARGDYLFFGNTVIIRPHTRHNRKFDKIGHSLKNDATEDADQKAAQLLREWRYLKSIGNAPLQ